MIKLVTGLMVLIVACTTKKESFNHFDPDSIWEVDSVSGNRILRPAETTFNGIVNDHFGLIRKDKVPEFMYNINLDTIYQAYGFMDSSRRSVRAGIINRISDREFLNRMLDDERLNEVWEAAKRDCVILRTNIDMIRERLIYLDKETNLALDSINKK